MPTVHVVAHDFLQRLTTGTKDRAFALSIPTHRQVPAARIPLVAALVGATNLLDPRQSIRPAPRCRS